MQSKAATVEEYLAELPADRRAAISVVRQVVLKNLDKDYEEGMSYGMIGYCVPHRVYPAGYHCDPKQPLPFVCLASQKNYMSLYLMTINEDTPDGKWFQKEWAKTGKKLDMGKCCLRFKKLEDLSLELVGEAIRRMPAKRFIAFYEDALKDMLRSTRKKKSPMKEASKKKTPKKAASRSSKAHGRATRSAAKR
jgi:hypothetical protein